jgi:hypothetical protein
MIDYNKAWLCLKQIHGVLEQWSVGVLALKQNIKGFKVLMIHKALDSSFRNDGKIYSLHYSNSPLLHHSKNIVMAWSPKPFSRGQKPTKCSEPGRFATPMSLFPSHCVIQQGRGAHD